VGCDCDQEVIKTNGDATGGRGNGKNLLLTARRKRGKKNPVAEGSGSGRDRREVTRRRKKQSKGTRKRRTEGRRTGRWTE